ncbi:Glycosyl transferase [Azospirillaceae bacterium]
MSRSTTPVGLAGQVILQVLPAMGAGGAEQGCLDVACALAQTGARPIVASSGGSRVEALISGGADHITLPLAGKTPQALIANTARLLHLIRKHDVALVHARSRAPAWSAWAACQQARIPFMTTFHAAYNFNSPMKKLYNTVMARGERVIAISEFIAEHIRTNYPSATQRIRIIPRAIDLERHRSDAVSAERIAILVECWGLDRSRPVILLPGRLSRPKGQMTLVEAMARLERTDVQCVMVGPDGGDGHFRQSLIERISALGLSRQIIVAETCHDMPAAYLLADVVVVASTQPEGFGRVAVEAQAMGRPVIATALGGLIELVKHGNTGWLIPPGNPEALAEALTHALEQTPSVREAMSARAVANVCPRYALKNMTDATLAVYSELIL